MKENAHYNFFIPYLLSLFLLFFIGTEFNLSLLRI